MATNLTMVRRYARKKKMDGRMMANPMRMGACMTYTFPQQYEIELQWQHMRQFNYNGLLRQ